GRAQSFQPIGGGFGNARPDDRALVGQDLSEISDHHDQFIRREPGIESLQQFSLFAVELPHGLSHHSRQRNCRTESLGAVIIAGRASAISPWAVSRLPYSRIECPEGKEESGCACPELWGRHGGRDENRAAPYQPQS
ncbi:hypothetical protein OY671_009796, partial [Metschnikowia pulcherrima]